MLGHPLAGLASIDWFVSALARERRAAAKAKGRRDVDSESDSDGDPEAASASDEDAAAGDAFFQHDGDPFDDPFFKAGRVVFHVVRRTCWKAGCGA